MVKVTHITPDFAVAPQIKTADIAALSKAGFATILNNRPDWEVGVPLSARKAAVEAWRSGLGYRYIPAAKEALFDEALPDAFEAALRDLPGPTLAYCQSGTRSAILWALVTARTEPVDSVLDALARVGIDIEFFRSELEEQAELRDIIAPVIGAQPPAYAAGADLRASPPLKARG